ncbi:MAG: hypothetical protein V7733_13570 [Paraglaciecola polaris]|uniref:hypothetical protein n=1 Tax=Paraglaciecola polaris TaxID=222814 RepID=UPI0030021FCE
MILASHYRLLPLSIAVAAALLSTSSFAQQDEQTEVIQVRGIRSSLSEAMALKKTAPSIKTA